MGWGVWEYKKITNNTNKKDETKFKFLINNIKNIKFWGGGGVGRDWGVWEEEDGGGGQAPGCPALAVAPAAGAPPVVPDPWALPKAPASGALPPCATCHVHSGGAWVGGALQ